MAHDIDQIPEFRLTPVPVGVEAASLAERPFRWASSDVGFRHKIGGKADFLQKPEQPTCGTCRIEMVFYGQLDSVSDDFSIADCGMIYVFLCFHCYEARAIVQSS